MLRIIICLFAVVQSMGFSQSKDQDIAAIDSKSKTKFELNFDSKYEAHDRYFFYNLRTDENQDMSYSKKPALVYVVNAQKKIMASYYFETVQGKYISQDCHCCHLEIESGNKLSVHCSETCKHVPKYSDISAHISKAHHIKAQ